MLNGQQEATHPCLNLDTTITGPKDSSLAMNMWSSTPVNTVGSMKNPGRDVSNSYTYTNRKYNQVLDHGNKGQINVNLPINVRWTVCSTWPVHLAAPAHQRGPFLHSHLAVLHQLVQVGLVVLGPVVRGPVQGVSDLHLLDLLHLRGRAERSVAQRRRFSFCCRLFRPSSGHL